MKRAFAILIVVLLTLGMVGLFFASFLQPTQSVAVPTTTTTAQ